jgi:hypothetical protein
VSKIILTKDIRDIRLNEKENFTGDLGKTVRGIVARVFTPLLDMLRKLAGLPLTILRKGTAMFGNIIFPGSQV